MITINQIRIELPLELVSKLCTCHSLFHEWSPGFISFELLKAGTVPMESVYLQKYTFNNKLIEEKIKILSLNHPSSMRLLSSSEYGSRESLIELHQLDDNMTQIVVRNEFTGALASAADQATVQSNTQSFLKAFKNFIEPWASVPEHIANHSCC